MPVLLQVPDRAAPALHRQVVFILRCNGAAAGSVQGIWDGLLHRTCGITSAEQHGDDLLHDVRVFYVGADQKNALYIGGCAACNIGGNCGKRMDRDLFIEKYINEIEKIGKTVYRIWCAELRELQNNGAIRIYIKEKERGEQPTPTKQPEAPEQHGAAQHTALTKE